MTTVCTRKIAFQRGTKKLQREVHTQKLIKVVKNVYYFLIKQTALLRNKSKRKVFLPLILPPPKKKKNFPFFRNEVM
jgi:hypothetical protein